MKTSGTEDPDMNPSSYAHLIFNKGTKNHIIEKRQPLQQMLLGKLDLCMQKTETFTPCKHHLSGLRTLI
jgi:hypothetical protein